MNSLSQSSSTLNNYVPQQAHQKHSDSSCSQCQHINIQNSKDSSSSSQNQQESSSHDNGDLVGPLHNHIVAHTRQLEKTLELLQFQVQKLKQSNKLKDRMIDQLKIQIKKYSATNLQDNIRRQSIQIQNLRRQLETQNSIPSSKSISSKHINQKLNRKNIQIIYQQKNKPFSFSQKSNALNSKQDKKKNFKQSINDNESDEEEGSLLKDYKQKNRKTSKEISKQTKKILKNAYQNQYKQKQKTFIEQQINYQQKIERLQKHIKICEGQMVWMTNFILGFLKMGQKLSFYFNQKIIYNNWTLKKKTKTVWRYIKQLLYHFMEVQNHQS